MPEFRFYTTPRDYQLEQFNRSELMEYFAVFWDMRLGKTKLMIDTFSKLFCLGKINAVLIVAKTNVCQAWQLEHLSTHLMPELQEIMSCMVFLTQGGRTQKRQKAVDALLHHDLPILIIPFDTFKTDVGKKVAWQMLKNRNVFYIVDESARIKKPGRARTRAIVKSGQYAAYRRILTGTPYTNDGAFDLYSQMKFLYKDFWSQYGIFNNQMYKAFFGKWETGYTRKGCKPGEDPKTFPDFKGHKNLHLLKQWVDPYMTRIMKDDMPGYVGKTYDKLYFNLTEKQWKLYNQLRDELLVQLEQGELVVMHHLALLLRFQQITCGYLPDPSDEEGNRLIQLDEENPRLNSLVEFTEDSPEQGVIWCRFTQDINLILERLGDSAQRYDGLVKEKHRPEVLKNFRNQKFPWLVAKATCLSEGENLSQCDLMIYYTNSFSLMDRIQSEERCVLLDKKRPVMVLDMVSDAPVCQHILKTLRDHQSVAQQIAGDRIKQWI